MRRLSPGYRRWLLRRARAGIAERSRSKRRGKRTNVHRSSLIPVTLYLGNDRTKKGWASTAGRPLPAVFCLDDNFEETVLFLNRIRVKISGRLTTALRGKHRLRSRRNMLNNPVGDWSDFSSIERITPAAALLLASEYDRMRHFSGTELFAIDVQRWKPAVYAVLKNLGLLPILGIDRPLALSEEADQDGVIVLPMRSGDTIVGEQADNLAREVAELAIAVSEGSRPDNEGADERGLENALHIYHIIMEAIGNVVEHAYPRDVHFPYPVVRRWWMTGAVDRVNRKLTLAVYDQGISIPLSLPRWSRLDQFFSAIAQIVGLAFDFNQTSNDGIAILGAMQVSKSSTEQEHRGQGLFLMADYLNRCRGGRLRILSRCGEYVLEKDSAPRHTSHPVSIGGTLVEWEIAL